MSDLPSCPICDSSCFEHQLEGEKYSEVNCDNTSCSYASTGPAHRALAEQAAKATVLDHLISRLRYAEGRPALAAQKAAWWHSCATNVLANERANRGLK